MKQFYVVIAWIFFALGAGAGMFMTPEQRAAAWSIRAYVMAQAIWWLGLAIYEQLGERRADTGGAR